MRPMKLTDVGTDVEAYVNDPNWIMQQKFDGARLVTVWKGGQLLFTNDGVSPIAFSAAKLKLPALEEKVMEWISRHRLTLVVLDGELIIETGEYKVFDVLTLFSEPDGEVIHIGQPLGVRLVHMKRYLSEDDGVLTTTFTAWTSDEKLALWNAVNKLGVEGAISKNLDSLYHPGTRSKEWLKHKLVKTADVVVTAAERKFKDNGVVSHGKAELAVPIDPKDDPQPYANARGKRQAMPGKGFVHKPREMLPVGNASLIGKDLAIGVGTVVEVEYLYWTGDAMIQPRITRMREDKTAAECDMAQFPEYTRVTVTP